MIVFEIKKMCIGQGKHLVTGTFKQLWKEQRLSGSEGYMSALAQSSKNLNIHASDLVIPYLGI